MYSFAFGPHFIGSAKPYLNPNIIDTKIIKKSNRKAKNNTMNPNVDYNVKSARKLIK